MVGDSHDDDHEQWRRDALRDAGNHQGPHGIDAEEVHAQGGQREEDNCP
jgi:hypothetical protein